MCVFLSQRTGCDSRGDIGGGGGGIGGGCIILLTYHDLWPDDLFVHIILSIPVR